MVPGWAWFGAVGGLSARSVKGAVVGPTHPLAQHKPRLHLSALCSCMWASCLGHTRTHGFRLLLGSCSNRVTHPKFTVTPQCTAARGQGVQPRRIDFWMHRFRFMSCQQHLPPCTAYVCWCHPGGYGPKPATACMSTAMCCNCKNGKAGSPTGHA